MVLDSPAKAPSRCSRRGAYAALVEHGVETTLIGIDHCRDFYLILTRESGV
jgi:hypothetical protein